MFASRGNRKEKIVPCISTPTEARGCDPPDALRPNTKQGQGKVRSIPRQSSERATFLHFSFGGFFRGPCITIRGQRGIEFIPVSNGLRAAFITSHNIYYVKSDTPNKPHGCFYITLHISILCDMNTGIVNNFSTTFDNKQ